MLLIGIISGIFHGFEYKQMGVFNILNLFPIWTPLAWMFVFMFYFYCMPVRKCYYYVYVLSFGLFGCMVGMVLKNLGLYKTNGIYIYLQPLVIIGFCGGGPGLSKGGEHPTPINFSPRISNTLPIQQSSNICYPLFPRYFEAAN